MPPAHSSAVTDIEAVRAEAPGKVFLLGEYAVLEGFGALIASVDRRARVDFVLAGGHTLSVESPLFKAPIETPARRASLEAAITGPAGRVLGGVLAACEILGLPHPPAGTLRVDSSALFEGSRKLGFGSSAAVLVATLGAIYRAHSGQSFDPEFARRALPIARHWHNVAQKTRGSGGDIAAALVGQVAYMKLGELAQAEVTQESVTLEALAPPAGLGIFVHPRSASTPRQVGAMRHYCEREPEAYSRHMERLGALAERGRQAVIARDGEGFVSLVRETNTALGSLGRDARVEIQTPLHDRVAAACEALGAACKPTGAGGGDISLVACRDDAHFAEVAARLAPQGMAIAALETSSAGLTAARRVPRYS